MTLEPRQSSFPAWAYMLAQEQERDERHKRYDRLVAAGWKPSEALVEIDR